MKTVLIDYAVISPAVLSAIIEKAYLPHFADGLISTKIFLNFGFMDAPI